MEITNTQLVKRCAHAVYLQVVGTGQYSSQFPQFGSNFKRLPSRPTFKPATRVCLFRFTSMLEIEPAPLIFSIRGEKAVCTEDKHYILKVWCTQTTKKHIFPSYLWRYLGDNRPDCGRFSLNLNTDTVALVTVS